VSASANPGAADEPVPKGFTAEDLRLGKRAAGHVRIVSAVAFLTCVGITLFVFLNVPWDTRMPYDGKYSSNGIPMQLALLVTLVPRWAISGGTGKSLTHITWAKLAGSGCTSSSHRWSSASSTSIGSWHEASSRRAATYDW
jgi:hypothetical protein